MHAVDIVDMACIICSSYYALFALQFCNYLAIFLSFVFLRPSKLLVAFGKA